MRHLPADELLERWARVEIATGGEPGYAGRTSLARAAHGELTTGGDFRSQLPRGVCLPGLREHGVVESVLRRFKPHYRETLRACYVLPSAVTGQTQREVAAWLGISYCSLVARLRRVREALNAPAR